MLLETWWWLESEHFSMEKKRTMRHHPILLPPTPSSKEESLMDHTKKEWNLEKLHQCFNSIGSTIIFILVSLIDAEDELICLTLD